MEERFAVVASEESYLQKDDGKAPRLPHRWTPARSDCGPRRRAPTEQAQLR